MIEAQIICCEKCEIPDLGLSLMPGQEEWVADAVARSSTDLQRVQGMGKVRVYRKARRMNRNPKRPPPPFVMRSRPQVVDRSTPKVVEKIVEKVVEKIVEVPQEVDTEKIKAELLKDLLPGLRAVVAEEMSKVVAQQAPQTPQQAPQQAPQGIDPEQLESVLERVVRRVIPAGGVASRTRKNAASEEPLFIPGNIVDKDVEAKIDVASKATEDTEDLDDAQAALREIKRRRRAKKNEEKP